MENKAEETKKKVEYTKQMLLDDILSTPADGEGNQNEIDQIRRNLIYKQKIVQTVFSMKLPALKLGKNDNREDIRTQIEMIVEEDAMLFGYTYYLSSNPVFDYNWSYLQKHINKYADFLLNAYLFVSCVLGNIKTLYPILLKRDNLHFDFSNLFVVTHTDNGPFIKTAIQWKNFNSITKLKKGYCLTAIYDETLLATTELCFGDSVDGFATSVDNLIQEWLDKKNE